MKIGRRLEIGKLNVNISQDILETVDDRLRLV